MSTTATYTVYTNYAADPYTNAEGELCVDVYTEIEVIEDGEYGERDLFNGYFGTFIVIEGKENQTDWGSNVENMVGCKVFGVEIEQHHLDDLKEQVLLAAQNSLWIAKYL